MIARLLPEPRTRRFAGIRITALALLPWLAVTMARAEPEPVFDPNFDPGFDAGFGSFEPTPGGFTPGDEAPAPTPAEPELKPPAIDAYLDIAALSADYGPLDFDANTSGFRLLAGFRFAAIGDGRWNVAPEISYLVFSDAERKERRVDAVSEPQYVVTIVSDYTLASSSLAFGARFGRPLNDRIEPYLRAGLHLFHELDRLEITYFYQPKSGPIPPKDPERISASSETDVSIGYYGVLGASLKIGASTSLYGEYGLLDANGESVGLGAIGLLLNF